MALPSAAAARDDTAPFAASPTAAAVALIRFKVGTVKVLLACGLAGVLLRSVLSLGA
jgi:hypothetical protein